MSAPRKAIFARSQTEARSYGRAFLLDPKDWSSFGFEAAIGSNREFDRIVVILPPTLRVTEFSAIANLRKQIAPKGVFEILGGEPEVPRTINNITIAKEPA